MADKKISQLTEKTTPVAADMLAIYDSETIATKKVAWSNVVTLAGTQELDNKTLDSSVAKGTWTASGTWTIPTVTLGGTVSGGGRSLSNLGTVYIGDTSNVKVTLGLTINQGGADDEILDFKSSDVAHGLTGQTETDTYAFWKKVSAAQGGLRHTIISGTGIGASVTLLNIIVAGANADTTKSTAGRAIAEFNLYQHDGANNIDNIVANGNIFGLRAFVSSAETTVLLVDEDGDLWLNGGITISSPMLYGANQVVGARVVNAGIDDAIEAAFGAVYPNASAVLTALQAGIQTHGLIKPS